MRVTIVLVHLTSMSVTHAIDEDDQCFNSFRLISAHSCTRTFEMQKHTRYVYLIAIATVFQTKVSLSDNSYFKRMCLSICSTFLNFSAYSFSKLQCLQCWNILLLGFLILQVLCSLECTHGSRSELILVQISDDTFHLRCLFQDPLLCYFLVVLQPVRYNKNVA